MSKIQFEAVNELMVEKKYAEARLLVKSMKKREAREWQAKLDTLDPQSRLNQAGRWSQIRRKLLIGIVLVLVVIVFGLLMLNMLGEFSPKVAHAQQVQMTGLARTMWAYIGVAESTATHTPTPTLSISPTPTPMPLPTPTVLFTPISPRTYYFECMTCDTSLWTCPRFNCPKTEVRAFPAIVVGVAIGDDSRYKGFNRWLKVQILVGDILVDRYAPVDEFTLRPFN